MKILFLDQSGKLGGAELSLADVVKPFSTQCLVALLSDGPFRNLLEQQGIPVEVLTPQSLLVSKKSSLLQGISSLGNLILLSFKVAQRLREFDLIYANTQKALVVGAIASFLAKRPLVYHLRDILSCDHFSSVNRRIAVTLANRFAMLVMSNSQATQQALIKAGGRPDISVVVYNGFAPESYCFDAATLIRARAEFGLGDRFVVGHFSRLSNWKGQHILLQALTHCSEDIAAVFVGDALFGEQDYVKFLHQQVKVLGLTNRVRFLGFRTDVGALMTGCNLIAHTSSAPEPFGRVIVEAMLCGRPVVASAAGGVLELVQPGKTGWLFSPGDASGLAELIQTCYRQPELVAAMGQQAKTEASERFHISKMQQEIARLLDQVIKSKQGMPPLDPV